MDLSSFNRGGIAFRSCFIIVPLCVLSSCASPPQYDAQTDTQLTNLQKEVDSKIVTFISDERLGDPASLKDASYTLNVKWYNQVDTDLETVELRMEAVPDPSTANLPQIFNNIRTALIVNVQTAHQKKGNLGIVDWTATRNQLNVQFAVLLTYELSLKSVGASSSSPTTQSTATKNASAKAAAPP
jgi:hypothetical protein